MKLLKAPETKDYRDTLPWLVQLARERTDLFDNEDQRDKFVSLLEGCSSAGELKGILAFPIASRFIAKRVITFE